MLPAEQERAKQRSQLFRKRTSFEDNIINEHIRQMLKAVQLTDLQLKNVALPTDDHTFEVIRTTRAIPAISHNNYLTE